MRTSLAAGLPVASSGVRRARQGPFRSSDVARPLVGTVVSIEQLESGTTFAGYRIDRILGSGSFGHVFLAEELKPQLQRKVALKVLRQELAADDAFRERFYRESLLVGRLDPHPGIVSVYDAGEEDGVLWIASRYVEGIDLRTLLEQRGRLEAEHVATITEQVADALDTAHAAGIIHRDVKPGNILLSQDLQRAHLADFGVSKTIGQATEGLTTAGQFVGTVKCASPEQLTGKPLDGRSDQYSLGCVVFECLTGRPPFEGSVESVTYAHVYHPLPDVTAFCPDLPTSVNAILRSGMGKSANDRYDRCTTFAVELSKPLRREDQTIVGASVVGNIPPPHPNEASPPAGDPTPASQPAPPGSPRHDTIIGGPGAPPPPGPPSPPSSSRPEHATSGSSSGSKGWLWALAILTTVTLIVLGVWLVSQGSSFPTEDEQALLAAVPSSLRAGCERDEPATANDGVVAAVTCAVDDDRADVATFRSYDSGSGRDDGFDEATDLGPVTLDEDRDCPFSTDALSGWSVDGDPRGQLACYRDDGSANLVWTSAGTSVLATARHDLGDGDELYAWWSDVVGADPPTQPFPSPPEAALLDLLPASLRSTCERDTAGGVDDDDNLLAALTCEPNDARVDSVTFLSAGDRGRIDAIFDERVAGSPVVASADTNCEFNTAATNDYVTDDLVAGRVACYRDGGASFLIWTAEELRLIGTARQDDRFDLDLYDWWAEQFGVPPSDLEQPLEPEPPPPTDADQLIAYVPTTFQATCVELDEPAYASELASVSCFPADGSAADAVVYALFADVADMQAAYDQELRDEDVAVDSGLDSCPGETFWVGPDDITNGRVACAPLEDDSIGLLWSDERIAVLTGAFDFSAEGDPEPLLGWWRADEGGPIP